MVLDFIIDQFERNLDEDAIIWKDRNYTYAYMLKKYDEWAAFLRDNALSGKVVGVQSDFNPDSICLMLALIEENNIFVPFSHATKDLEDYLRIAEAEFVFRFGDTGHPFEKTGIEASHELIQTVRERGHPGIIIFSSGSTGDPKAAIHDFTFLLNKFKIKRRTLRTVTFLLFDHWGGINTLLYILSNGGTVGVPRERSPEKVCEFIEKHRIELLPTTPSFINLILISGAYEKYDLSSLKIVSYGTEMMPESTLKAFHRLYPDIELKQTYGLTELGVMRTISRSSDSLWLKVGGEDYQTKVKDGILFIKAASSILGYLNAESPFDEDGWYNTEDRVIQDGEWIKFLGRESDIINVGGQKVYPAEVESVLMEMDDIVDASVYARPNPIMGSIVAARVTTRQDTSASVLKQSIREFCKDRLESFKIPAFVEIKDRIEISDRFKKIR